MLIVSSAADCGARVPSLAPSLGPSIAAGYGGHGWTAELKARFLDHLAGKGNVRAACARVGLSAQAAYRLRRRDGLFGRAWAAALVLARESCVQVLAERALDGIEEPVWHRGEMVGTRRRYDTRLLLAHIGRLDRLVEEETASTDAGRFDELLARIAGEAIPETLPSTDGLLPLEREASIDLAQRDALSAVYWDMEDEDEAQDGDSDGSEAADCPEDAESEAGWSEEERAAHIDERLMQAEERGRADGAADWDAWFTRACEVVDKAADCPAAPAPSPPGPGLPGSGLPLAITQAIKEAARDAAKLPEFSLPCTVSTVSTATLARALSKPARWQHPQTYAPPSRAALKKRARGRL